MKKTIYDLFKMIKFFLKIYYDFNWLIITISIFLLIIIIIIIIIINMTY
jgi:hypothetical protein